MSLENSINRLTQVIKAAGGGMSSPTSPYLPGDDQFPRGGGIVSTCVQAKSQITNNGNIKILGCLEQTGGTSPGCQCTTYQRSTRNGPISITGPVAVPCKFSECITQPVMF
jgi:hypothetical protein